MSDCNEFLDFSAPKFGLDAVEPKDSTCAFILDQPGCWALSPSFPLIGEDTLEQPQTYGDPALAKNAESLGRIRDSLDSVPNLACAVCLEPYQTDFALHRHAKESGHHSYKCQCGTGFNKASALKRHIETKDAPKTFACTLCYDKFTRKDKLKDHCRHYHKVSDQGLQFLFTSQEAKTRAGAASRRRQGPVPRTTAAASSGNPASPAHAPATVGPSVSSFPASTGQQYAGVPAGPSDSPGLHAATSASQVPNSFFGPAGPFFPSTGTFAVDPTLGKNFSVPLDNFSGNDGWATGFDGFNF